LMAKVSGIIFQTGNVTRKPEQYANERGFVVIE
jgi:hypothetical protein